MKPLFRLAYKNMWPNHDPEMQQPRDFFRACLEQHYTVVIDNQTPDLVVYSLGGPPATGEYYTDPILVGYSGECQDAPGSCDLRLGFHHNQETNYKRLPLWVLYIDWDIKNPTSHPLHISNILKRHTQPHNEKPQFCNFTYRNPVKSRIEFFMALNQKQRVDSTGQLFNNTGKLLGDKPVELQDYRFTIAWESNIMQGYVTEKLLEPLAAGSIPIYCGGSESINDFNPLAFINILNFADTKQAIDYILHVDADENLRRKYLMEPVWIQAPTWPQQVFTWLYSCIEHKKPHLIL